MSRMIIRYDTEVGAYYVRAADTPVARTVHISDDVAVDLDAAGAVHGLEVLCAPSLLTAGERAALSDRFPAAGELLGQLEQLVRPLSA